MDGRLREIQLKIKSNYLTKRAIKQWNGLLSGIMDILLFSNKNQADIYPELNEDSYLGQWLELEDTQGQLDPRQVDGTLHVYCKASVIVEDIKQIWNKMKRFLNF